MGATAQAFSLPQEEPGVARALAAALHLLGLPCTSDGHILPIPAAGEPRLRLGVLLDRACAPELLRLGGLVVDLAGRRLMRDDGQPIMLTDSEAELLSALIAAGGEPVSRAALLGEVLGYADPENSRTLETHIWRLRQKLEVDPVARAALVTRAGGYALQLPSAPGSPA